MFRAEHAWPGLGSCCARPHVRVDGDALNKAIALAGILLKKPVLPDQPTDISRVVLDDVGDRNATIFAQRHDRAGLLLPYCQPHRNSSKKASSIKLTPQDPAHRRALATRGKSTAGAKFSS